MLTKRLVGFLLLLSLSATPTWAQSNLADWNNVRSLSPGSTIAVKTKTGKTYRGRLESVTDQSLSMDVRAGLFKRRVIDVNKDEVREVRQNGSRATGAIVGGLVGTGVGVGIGAIVDATHPGTDDPGLGKAVFGLLGGLFGSAIGS